MVDTNLPSPPTDRGLRYAFLDLNAYFASVEQQERPELRGKPVAVAPVMAASGTCIAASYEAKRFGVRTGTLVGDARDLCPEIEIVDARPKLYVEYHQRVLAAVETVLPIEEVCSIDEMRFRLIGDERDPEEARRIGLRLKRAIRERVGETLTCSVGIATNGFLAKVGTEIEKPDGLVVIEAKDLPHKLHPFKLTDFPGINRRMQARLNASGIFTTEDMCRASKHEMLAGFGSVIGERWYYLLQGYDVGAVPTSRKSLGHSHILPPSLRTEQGCREVLLRLLQKASARLRAEGLWTSSMTIYVSGKDRSWNVRLRLPPTQDTVTLNERFLDAWKDRDFAIPRGVGVTFHDLRVADHVTPSLFDPTQDRAHLNHAVDDINRRFGKNKIYLAGMEHAKDTADEKIAFNKTWLFCEGKGDNALFDGEDPP